MSADRNLAPQGNVALAASAWAIVWILITEAEPLASPPLIITLGSAKKCAAPSTFPCRRASDQALITPTAEGFAWTPVGPGAGIVIVPPGELVFGGVAGTVFGGVAGTVFGGLVWIPACCWVLVRCSAELDPPDPQPPSASAATDTTPTTRTRTTVIAYMIAPRNPGPAERQAPATIDSWPAQYGARSSCLSSLPAPDFGRGSLRTSIRLGTL